MASSYPEELDDFQEPLLPEETPLSSAGSSTRTHFEHHRDLGDAIEAIQANASQKTHTHDGTDTTTGGPKLLAANTHESPDTDTADSSLHHTLGTGEFQAAPGNHVHAYGDILNRPFEVCTSTSRPSDPIPGMMIYEVDTNRIRVWASFSDNQLATGILSADFFERVNVTNLTPTYWEQTYTFSPTTRGRLAIPDGHNASWIDQSGDPNRVLARRTYSADAETLTDDQAITWKTGGDLIEEDTILDEATNDAYLRLSADKRHFIRLRCAQGYIQVLYTTTGWGGGEKELGRLYCNTRGANYEWRAEIEDYTLRVYRNGDHMGTVTDKGQKSTKGPGARGWGIGMEAGDRLLWGQITPADLQWVRIADLPTYTSITRWSLLPIADKPVVILRNSMEQQLEHTGTDIQWASVVEDGFGMFNRNDPTKVTITEPGLYHIDASLQWNPQVVPDVAHAVVVVNNQETEMRDSKYMRGGLLFQPGFSQSLNMSGKIRLSIGDVITLRAKYTAAGPLLGEIFSWFDAPSRVNSRFEMSYLSV